MCGNCNVFFSTPFAFTGLYYQPLCFMGGSKSSKTKLS